MIRVWRWKKGVFSLLFFRNFDKIPFFRVSSYLNGIILFEKTTTTDKRYVCVLLCKTG